ncbi:MAG: archease [Syntrophaceae bacterium]|nr:archease [Syntrophaceae bacterium]
MTEKPFRLFDHTADLGVEVFGTTEAELFVNAALAVVALSTDPEKITSAEERHFTVEGADSADLFVNYLREVLYLINGEGFLTCEVNLVEIQPHYLSVTVRGERYDTRKHRINKEIKAVTYHQATVEKTATGWKGRVIFDV